MSHGVKTMAATAAALSMVAAMPARAADGIKAGGWDLSFSGNVNAFATYRMCGSSGGAMTGLALACDKASGGPNQFSIESGLLPSALVASAKTRALDMDTSATLGFYPGLHVADTRTGVGSNNNFSIDVRQLFLTFGDKSWGTVKLGKDIGLFGSDVILSDMLLLGVGAGTHGSINHNVTIGHIGTGYLYADWIPQVAYSTPTFGGAQLTVAVTEAFGASHLDANGNLADLSGFLGIPNLNNETPGVQARVSYDFAGPAPGRAWVGGMYQNAKLSAAPYTSLDTIAGEAGVKASVSGLSALAYGYYGDGVGTTVIGLDATPGTVTGNAFNTRKSYGFFGQLTYAIPDTKLKPGVSYGQSFLDRASGETDATMLKSNSMITGALFYSVTSALTLTAEFDHLRSTNHGGGLWTSNSAALGGIIFF